VPNRPARDELRDHNYCRNPNPNKESRPWCFTGPRGEYEYCDIPYCGKIRKGLDLSKLASMHFLLFSKGPLTSHLPSNPFFLLFSIAVSKKSHLTGRCKPKHFECLPGECIPSPWVCDGEEVRSVNFDEIVAPLLA
jgi:hypothetical protein